MTYRAPLAHVRQALNQAGLNADCYKDFDAELVDSVLREAARFAEERIAPLNSVGDRVGSKLVEGIVVTPPGWKEVYRDWTEAGWNALPASPDWDGQGLPALLHVACTEIWNSASMAFALAPLLTAGAIDALTHHASDELKRLYLPNLVSGRWTGTMNLTEPQAGSDLSTVRTRAERQDDGTYRIRGQKIYITYGEHDMTDNIVHLVLARLPDAPAGTAGISLFLVPKVLPDGNRNDLRCHSLEHKLGIHASPTCTMIFGDGDGAIGWLVGEEHRGLQCMFTMMNSARLAIGVQGVGIAERAYQLALGYAGERQQGRIGGKPAVILAHPDIRRQLMLMQSKIMAARCICFATAAEIDRANLSTGDAERKLGAELAGLLTPIAKAFSTDVGCEVADLGVQIHGGMGYVEETGAAQHLRDARIAPIYEGTNAIQAIDLVTRKLPHSPAALKHVFEGMQAVHQTIELGGDSRLTPIANRLAETIECLKRATTGLIEMQADGNRDHALAGATSYLRLFAYSFALTELTAIAISAVSEDSEDTHALSIARFFAEHVACFAPALADLSLAGPPPSIFAA